VISQGDNNRLTMDVAEVARAIGVSKDTVYEGARTGDVPGSLRVGRRLLFSRAAIERWINAESEK